MRVWMRRLWEHAQGLCGSVPDAVPVRTGEVDTSSFPNPEAVLIDNHLQRKTYFSPTECHWGQKHLRTADLAIGGQQKINWMLPLEVLYLIKVSGFLFSFHYKSFTYIMTSGFVFMRDLCVWTCVLWGLSVFLVGFFCLFCPILIFFWLSFLL